MDSNYVNKQYCKEHGIRIDESLERHDKAIEKLDKQYEDNHELLLSIERLVIAVESIQNQLKDHGERLKAIEDRDGDAWRAVKWSVLTLILGAIVGYVMSNVGF